MSEQGNLTEIVSNVVDWAVNQPLDMEVPGGPNNPGWGVRALRGPAAQRGPVASAPPRGGTAQWTVDSGLSR